MIFVQTRQECVTLSIKILLSHFIVFYFMTCLDISGKIAFLIKRTVPKILKIGVVMK